MLRDREASARTAHLCRKQALFATASDELKAKFSDLAVSNASCLKRSFEKFIGVRRIDARQRNSNDIQGRRLLCRITLLDVQTSAIRKNIIVSLF